MNKTIAVAIMIIIVFSIIGPNNTTREYAQNDLELPRMGKVLTYHIKYKTGGLSGSITFSVHITRAEFVDENVKIYYEYNYTAIQQINEGTSVEYSSSGNGTTSDIVRICLRLRYSPSIICPTIALLPKTAPHFLSYWSLNSAIVSSQGKYDYKVVSVEKTSRNGGLAIRIDTKHTDELNGSVPMSYRYFSITYSIAYALMIKYNYTSNSEIFRLELKEFPRMEPIKGKSISPPFKKASRVLSFAGVDNGLTFMDFKGSIEVEIKSAYDYAGGYWFFATRSGSGRLDYYRDQTIYKSIEYELSGLGVFGYSELYPRAPIGDTSLFVYPFIVYPQDIEESINALGKQQGLSVSISNSKVFVGNDEYEGYLITLEGEYLKISAYLLDNGLVSHMNKTSAMYESPTIYSGRYYVGNATMTSIEFSSFPNLVIIIGMAVIALIIIVLYLRRVGKIRFLKGFIFYIITFSTIITSAIPTIISINNIKSQSPQENSLYPDAFLRGYPYTKTTGPKRIIAAGEKYLGRIISRNAP